jgi:hypothetical protein
LPSLARHSKSRLASAALHAGAFRSTELTNKAFQPRPSARLNFDVGIVSGIVMTHSVTAVLGEKKILSALAERESLHPPVEAKAGVWVLALNERCLDSLAGIPVGEPLAGFTYLFPRLLSKLVEASSDGWLIYVETDYFGGMGDQGAVAVKNGRVFYGPTRSSIGSINAALVSVGIKTESDAIDEFETIGLDMKRRTSDWLPFDEDDDDA